MKKDIGQYTLSNGTRIPCIGFGTYQTGNGKTNIHTLAIEQGFRFFDTASLYETERSLGEGIRESGIRREDLTIQTKLWHDERGYKEAGEALERSLARLGVDYVDIYLIHWPKSPGEGSESLEKNLDTLRAMEEARKKGLIRGIGVSNFLPHHLEGILESDHSIPLVDQLELHTGYMQTEAVNFLKEHDILPQAWSPLARGKGTDDAVLGKIADKYGKTVAQIGIRYLLEKGIMPIVKASSKEHMEQNLSVFDFELSFEDISLMDSYPYNTWLGEHPDLHIPTKASNPNQ